VTDKEERGPFEVPHVSLRQTLFLGAALGILLPALVLAYFQIIGKFENEVTVRVREPMEKYVAVLSRAMVMAVWNFDETLANEIADSVMANPDVISFVVTGHQQEIFIQKGKVVPLSKVVLQHDREIVYSGVHIGKLVLQFSTERVRRVLIRELLEQAAALGAQVLISFLLIWVLFDRRLVRPLRQLQEHAACFARGELDRPLAHYRQDEIGHLAQGLDTMRADLANMIHERDVRNQELQSELTERQRAQAELGFSQAKFQSIFSASPVAMTVSRVGGGFELLDVNVAWTRVFGRDRASMLGTSGENNGMWKSQQDRSSVLETLSLDGEISRFAAWMQPGAGRAPILCEISGKVVRSGNDSMLILAYDDITAKNKYEAEILELNATLEQRVTERTHELSDALSQLQAAQSELIRTEKMSALGFLVAGIAHELNTPIGNSVTVASTLQDNAVEFQSSMQKGLSRSRLDAFVSSIREGSDILMRSLQRAIELISSFKQVAVDQTSVKRRQFDLKEMVDNILLTMGPTIRKTKHAVESSIPKGISMDSYPGPLGQVLNNLINNAFLHAFEGVGQGHVMISAELAGDSHVRLSFRDDGLGIPAQHLKRVFDPFFTTKLGRGGSGLGLNIVYNLVHDALGGEIQVESEPGQGACFTVTLPLQAPVGQTENQ
jgi:PAS domain S-box-containing protein